MPVVRAQVQVKVTYGCCLKFWAQGNGLRVGTLKLIEYFTVCIHLRSG